MKTTRLSIGDFAKMTYLSIKSLRRYHEMGLLVPAEVDGVSGYRYYAPSQVPVGQVIRRFRDLGMPLEQVRDVLEAPDPAVRNEVIVTHLRAMESALRQTQHTVASLRALLEGPPAPISVAYRSAEPARVLAITEPVAMGDIEGWWQEAFAVLHDVLGSAGAQRAGPDGALYASEFFQDGRGGVVAFIPASQLPRSFRSDGRVRLIEIPGAELAVTVHEGSFAELDRTYGALGTYVCEREIGVQGPIREHYLVTGADTPDESAHRTEVCWPVFHTKGAA
ncbi:MAG TPA: MerR family transcriptional regulator [Streptosporangiaceae bacterium]|nr:MerR family transcriptional regulator [Streptosporangiaceae bacterium]